MNKEKRIAEEICQRGWKNFVTTAEIEAEVDVFDDVAACVDGDHGQQQSRRAERAWISNIEDRDGD
jgi:hypothetical protein